MQTSGASVYFIYFFIYLFGVLRRFQHCTGHITTGSWKGRGNQYIEFTRVVYCKLPTNGKQLPAFPLKGVTGIEPRPQRWQARVLPLCHRGPLLGPRSNEYKRNRRNFSYLIIENKIPQHLKVFSALLEHLYGLFIWQTKFAL